MQIYVLVILPRDRRVQVLAARWSWDPVALDLLVLVDQRQLMALNPGLCGLSPSSWRYLGHRGIHSRLVWLIFALNYLLQAYIILVQYGETRICGQRLD